MERFYLVVYHVGEHGESARIRSTCIRGAVGKRTCPALDLIWWELNIILIVVDTFM